VGAQAVAPAQNVEKQQQDQRQAFSASPARRRGSVRVPRARPHQFRGHHLGIRKRFFLVAERVARGLGVGGFIQVHAARIQRGSRQDHGTPDFILALRWPQAIMTRDQVVRFQAFSTG
jgi:hypothetical protein